MSWGDRAGGRARPPSSARVDAPRVRVVSDVPLATSPAGASAKEAMFLCVCAESMPRQPLTATEDTPAGIFFVARSSRRGSRSRSNPHTATPRRERGEFRLSHQAPQIRSRGRPATLSAAVRRRHRSLVGPSSLRGRARVEARRGRGLRGLRRTRGSTLRRARHAVRRGGQHAASEVGQGRVRRARRRAREGGGCEVRR